MPKLDYLFLVFVKPLSLCFVYPSFVLDVCSFLFLFLDAFSSSTYFEFESFNLILNNLI
jgi:hypothetical protein